METSSRMGIASVPNFSSRGRLIALAAAGLAIIVLGLLYALANRRSCPGACPTAPVAANGSVVSDRFWFVHRGLGPHGSITARLTVMTGTITYPPPNHDQIVPGLVPWAKAGIIIKDGLRRGSPYAAVMMTGSHGVRFQYDYRYDIAGSAGAAAQFPHWLRLTRSGDTITGAESADGSEWHTIATARLDGLPDTVQVGLFATSPGDLTLRKTGFGGAIEEVRFTQAVGTFDHVSVKGGTPGQWESEPVGEMNRTDWEKRHHASGSVERSGVIEVSGAGDIGPLSDEGAIPVEKTLVGLPVALIIVLIAAARFGARIGRDPVGRRVIIPRGADVGLAAFVTGLIAVGITLPAGVAILEGSGIPVQTVPLITTVRVIVGVAAAFALCAVVTYALGAWLRRGWAAALVGLLLIVLPYVVATLPLLPDSTAQWLLRVTPAAAFAIVQTTVEYGQVTAHYAPSAGYFPLPGWAGMLVLCGYTVLAMWLAVGSRSGRPAQMSEPLPKGF